jgi:hypothetical protein
MLLIGTPAAIFVCEGKNIILPLIRLRSIKEQ